MRLGLFVGKLFVEGMKNDVDFVILRPFDWLFLAMKEFYIFSNWFNFCMVSIILSWFMGVYLMTCDLLMGSGQEQESF